MESMNVVVTYPDERKYAYTGLPLIKSIAMKILVLLYEGEGPFKRIDATEKVFNYHVTNGGLPQRGNLTALIKMALGSQGLRKDNISINIIPSAGYWDIPAIPLTIGQGIGSVYLYFFPHDKTAAIQQGSFSWKCKIGYTDGLVSERVKEQIQGASENPFIPLIIKSDNPREIEQHIHEILFALGRHVEDAPGTEWFITNRDEVIDIYERIQAT